VKVVPFLAESDKASTTECGPATRTLNGSHGAGHPLHPPPAPGPCRAGPPLLFIRATAIHAELKALGVCPRLRADHRVSDVLSDRNSPGLMSRLAGVRLQLREKSMIGLGRSAGEAQQGTGSWLGSV
jgi:hypothetical protein